MDSFPLGVFVAEQQLPDGGGTLPSRQPGDQQRFGEPRRFFQHQRPSRENHRNEIGIYRYHPPQKGLLDFRQRKPDGGCRLTALLDVFAQCQNHHVRLGSGLFRLPEHGFAGIAGHALTANAGSARKRRAGGQQGTAGKKRVGNSRRRKRLGKGLVFLYISEKRPGAVQLLCVAVGADQRDALPGPGQRQQIVPVFQQYHTFPCHLPGKGNMRFRHRRGVFFRVRAMGVVFKQPQFVFQGQYPVHGLVQPGFRNGSVPNQSFQTPDVGAGHHFDVHTGFHGKLCCMGVVCGGADFDQLLHGAPVGDGHAVKAHFIPENFRQQIGISGAGHPVNAVEGRHDHRRAAPDARGVAGQMLLPQRVIRQLRAGVLPASGPLKSSP